MKEDNWTNIAYVSHDLGVIMKTELWQNGKLVQIMEATEFNLENLRNHCLRFPKHIQSMKPTSKFATETLQNKAEFFSISKEYKNEISK